MYFLEIPHDLILSKAKVRRSENLQELVTSDEVTNERRTDGCMRRAFLVSINFNRVHSAAPGAQ